MRRFINQQRMNDFFSIFVNFLSFFALIVLFPSSSCDTISIDQLKPSNEGIEHHFQVFRQWKINQSKNVSNNVEIKLLISHNLDKNVYKLDIHVAYDEKCLQDKEMIQSICKSEDFYSHAMKYGPDEIVVFIEGPVLLDMLRLVFYSYISLSLTRYFDMSIIRSIYLSIYLGKTLQSFIPHYKGCQHYEHKFSVGISGLQYYVF